MEKKHDIKKALPNYMKALEDRMAEHMAMDEGASNSSIVDVMYARWANLRKMKKCLEHCELKPAELTAWVEGLKNSDGSTGAHWTQEQTTTVAKMVNVMMSHVTPEEFWAAMNVMYSDYSTVADKFGVNKPEFFAELAKSFLFDKDGPDPEDKLAAYYWAIAADED